MIQLKHEKALYTFADTINHALNLYNRYINGNHTVSNDYMFTTIDNAYQAVTNKSGLVKPLEHQINVIKDASMILNYFIRASGDNQKHPTNPTEKPNPTDVMNLFQTHYEYVKQTYKDKNKKIQSLIMCETYIKSAMSHNQYWAKFPETLNTNAVTGTV